MAISLETSSKNGALGGHKWRFRCIHPQQMELLPILLGPKMTISLHTSSKIGAFIDLVLASLLEGPKTAQHSPTRRPKRAPRWPKMASRWPPRGLKTVQDDFSDGSRAAKRLQCCQERSKTAQAGLKTAQEAPKKTQEGPKSQIIVIFHKILSDFSDLAFSSSRLAQKSQEAAEIAPRLPRSPQDGPGSPGDGPRGSQDGPRVAQEGAKKARTCHLDGPRRPPDCQRGPETTQKRSNTA